jgi:curved DNA-binding protein CbpA
MNYYEIFDIPLNSTKDQIRIAFKKLAVKNHPDKGGTNEKFIQIKNIYETLTDPNKKIIYDRSIRSSNIDDYLKKSKINEFSTDHKEEKKWYQSRKHQRWTIIEEELLIRLVKENKSPIDIADQLNRSITAIKSRMSKLKINNGPKTSCWIDEEEELLTKLFNENKSLEEISKQLNRTVKSIHSKIKKLKLQEIKDQENLYTNVGYKKDEKKDEKKKKSKRWTIIEEDLLAKLFKTTSIDEIAIKLDRSVSAVKARCNKLKLKKT